MVVLFRKWLTFLSTEQHEGQLLELSSTSQKVSQMRFFANCFPQNMVFHEIDVIFEIYVFHCIFLFVMEAVGIYFFETTQLE
jgi:hypothetical protein